MVASLREKLNDAPPWMAYTIVGVLLAVVVAVAVLGLRPRQGGGPPAAVNFFCRECDYGFTVPGEKAQQLFAEAEKANPGLQRFVKCPECGKYGCVVCTQCPECGSYYTVPPAEEGMPVKGFRDACPDCGFSAERDRAIKKAMRQKAQGTYDPTKLPDYVREAVEDYEYEQDRRRE